MQRGLSAIAEHLVLPASHFPICKCSAVICSVVSVCVCYCLVHNAVTFQSLDLENSFWYAGVTFAESLVYQGHRVKFTGAKERVRRWSAAVD